MRDKSTISSLLPIKKQPSSWKYIAYVYPYFFPWEFLMCSWTIKLQEEMLSCYWLWRQHMKTASTPEGRNHSVKMVLYPFHLALVITRAELAEIPLFSSPQSSLKNIKVSLNFIPYCCQWLSTDLISISRMTLHRNFSHCTSKQHIPLKLRSGFSISNQEDCKF